MGWPDVIVMSVN